MTPVPSWPALRSGLSAALLMAALSTVLGCSAPATPGSGPLDGPDWGKPDQAETCVPARPGAKVTFGGDVLRNYGSKDVVIDKVSLLQPHGLKFVDAVLLTTHNTLVGFDNHYPPRRSFLDGLAPAWDHRRPAAGATITPQPGGGTPDDGATQKAKAAATAAATPATPTAPTLSNNLVVGVRVTGTSHIRMTGVSVDYHIGNKKYRWHNITSLVVKTTPAC